MNIGDRINKAVAKFMIAGWDAVAEEFPEVEYGLDAPRINQDKLQKAIESVVQQWIGFRINVKQEKKKDHAFEKESDDWEKYHNSRKYTPKNTDDRLKTEIKEMVREEIQQLLNEGEK